MQEDSRARAGCRALRWCACNADMNRIISLLKQAGLCSEVVYKELYVTEAEVAGARRAVPARRPLLVCPLPAAAQAPG